MWVLGHLVAAPGPAALSLRVPGAEGALVPAVQRVGGGVLLCGIHRALE